ncbi:polynucleotide phosphorylase/polyadenylase [Buchnera aphidicola (Nipponaphis monzeni)]|uniref:Polyribonucleotide nucleotidyltransferase n=1 Tax=Buchnera aphidicola (Nipponaphis monzeni) TaxID=2495405 RepID=A0A455TAC7_9GAMM|nr:polyribonucleotide nucleotidyltransferase [Buchnera aphidicola]BBI01294.1 polynucleotide phosphorylase/polyadenylase [Buchnera aphidicola (Nipponaphis monzeni)]
MLNPIVHNFKYGKHTVILETGIIARQATAAVIVNVEDTTVLVTMVTQNKENLENNFFPLTINYQERAYAAGKIPGGFFRREGRPNENEVLISRLIDRPIRPLFPTNFLNEIQIIITVLSVNPQINPDVVSIIGVSTVLCLSGIPFNGPIGVARVGLLNDQYILNPTVDELKSSSLDMVISGTENAIIMVESESNILEENKILNGILFGHEQQQLLIDNIKKFVSKSKNTFVEYSLMPTNQDLLEKVIQLGTNQFLESYNILNKKERLKKINIIKNEIIQVLSCENYDLSTINFENMFYILEKEIIRNRILDGGLRIDKRKNDVVRPLDIRVGILPKAHGSSLFTRGNTQALVSITLGTSRDAQNLDELLGDKTDNFLFHYNFPPYSVGEIGIIGSPKRREIGHGRLAKRSLLSVMPHIDNFPYTIRIVSEITESDGSSSMASVCGASLALMDAGVPIESSVAGVAMGLIKNSDKYVILSDISGEEDHLGDMDFKVAGTYKGITALQMDMKIEGVTNNIILSSLNQAKEARIHILDCMGKTLHVPRKEISEFAPRIHTIKINPEKIKDVIGKGGSVIRMLTEETGTIIEIEDDGTIKISASIEEKAKHAIRRIESITADVEVGNVYSGKVTRIVDFGAFISIGIGKEGLVHISQISNKHINKVSDYLKLDQIVFVKVLEIDRQGRLRLSIKAAT